MNLLCGAVYEMIIDNIAREDGTWLEELLNYMEEIYEHGCHTGIVPQLIYTKDCEEFVKTHLMAILELFEELIEEGYMESMPTDVTHIAWTTFELITRKIYVELAEEE